MIRPINGFTRKKIVIPVIRLPHNVKEGMRSVHTAVASNADGVFLIGQGMDKETMLGPMYTTARTSYPDLWIGANVFEEEPSDVIRKYKHKLNGIWSNDAGVDSLNFKSSLKVMNDMINACIEPSGRVWKGTYFGGMQIKTCPHTSTKQFNRLTYLSHHIDVITVFSLAAEKAPDLYSIEMLRSVIGADRHLAIASGITLKNVSQYLPYVDAFLVADGIESEFGELDPHKTKDLIDIVQLRR